MYKLLVVDDETYAVKGITKTIDWTSIQVTEILAAYSAYEAIELLKLYSIDVMIADIEMPGMDGLALHEWASVHSPGTITIFLTGHASFAYAQKAMQQGAFNYLLKPVDHDELKNIAQEAIAKVETRRETEELGSQFHKYAQLWNSRLGDLTDRFWQEFLEHRKTFSRTRLLQSLEQLELRLLPEDHASLVLISVEQWHKNLSSRDEEIMLYAIRSAAWDIMLEDLPDKQGCILQDSNGSVVVILPEISHSSQTSDVIKLKAQQVIEACSTYFYADVSCYISDQATVQELPEQYEQLLQMEQNNLHQTTTVVHGSLLRKQAAAVSVPWLPDWKPLLELGKKEVLMEKISDLFQSLKSNRNVTHEHLETLRNGLLYLINSLNLNHGNSMSSYRQLLKEDATRSIDAFEQWTIRLFEQCLQYLNRNDGDASSIVQQIKLYIQDHICEELTRSTIAAKVYLNPSYLSRLFKKETGTGLVEYILQCRMELARQLLIDTNMTVSSIAEQVGYTHFSHFSKMFRQLYGIAPVEYRKKYQKMNE
jgi:two-component system response regulator YesN